MIKCQFSCHARAAAVRLPTTFRLSDYTHVPFFHIHSPHNTGSPLQPRDPDQCTRARVRTHLLFRRHSSSSRKPAAVRPQAHRDVLIRCAGGLYTSHQAHTHTHTHTQTHTHAHTHTRTHTHTHTHTPQNHSQTRRTDTHRTKCATPGATRTYRRRTHRALRPPRPINPRRHPRHLLGPSRRPRRCLSLCPASCASSPASSTARPPLAPRKK